MIDSKAAVLETNKMASDIMTSLIKEAITNGWNRVKKHFKDINAKQSIDYGSAVY